MADLTLQQICSIATAYNQGRGDYTLSEASFYANIALLEVATRVQMKPLEALAVSSTSIGENKMALPTDFDYPISLSYLTVGAGYGATLQLRDAPLLDSASTFQAPPAYYAIYSTWMELQPTPDSGYSLQLRYGARMRSMMASTDTPALSERYHYPVALKTAALLSAARNDAEQEALNIQRYLDYMGSTPSDQAFRQRDKLSMRASVPKYYGPEWPH
jgi:hypothetical protein